MLELGVIIVVNSCVNSCVNMLRGLHYSSTRQQFVASYEYILLKQDTKYLVIVNKNELLCISNTATSLKGRGPFGAIRPLRGLFVNINTSAKGR